MSSLSQSHVVITGAAGALGGAVVARLTAAGMVVHAPGRADLDLTDEEAVTRVYAGLPTLAASVHLAGGYAGAAVLDTPLAMLRSQLEINLVTAFLCCREAARNMRRGGAGGRIVNVASRAALVPSGGAVAYTAAKGAVAALTLAAAEELRADGILVAAVAPSVMDTPANRTAMPDADFTRWPTVDEVARTIAWLVSPENTLVSGTVIPIYGRA